MPRSPRKYSYYRKENKMTTHSLDERFLQLLLKKEKKKKCLMKSRKSQKKFEAIFKPYTKREIKKDLKRLGIC